MSAAVAAMTCSAAFWLTLALLALHYTNGRAVQSLAADTWVDDLAGAAVLEAPGRRVQDLSQLESSWSHSPQQRRSLAQAPSAPGMLPRLHYYFVMVVTYGCLRLSAASERALNQSVSQNSQGTRRKQAAPRCPLLVDACS